MFKFKVGQHVWFLIGPLDDDEDIEFLHGTIMKCYTDEDCIHGSPDAYYEISVAGDGIYDREEDDLYGSLAELQKAVTEGLRGELKYYEDRVRDISAELKEARADVNTCRRRLRVWQQRWQPTQINLNKETDK